jgi:hypothetical protein
MPNHTARFKTTPTTAAVILESAPVSFLLPLNFSIYGPPKNMKRKHGRQEKQDTGRNTARNFVEQPADVSGQLLCLRAGQQHTVPEEALTILILSHGWRDAAHNNLKPYKPKKMRSIK